MSTPRNAKLAVGSAILIGAFGSLVAGGMQSSTLRAMKKLGFDVHHVDPRRGAGRYPDVRAGPSLPPVTHGGKIV